MRLPTESQWARYSALCARLRPMPALERDAALQALRATGAEDPQVLSLVAVHLALPPDPVRLRTGERLGNFTLEEPLGVGGMGVVYRAQQHLGPAIRPVAVKLIHPTLLLTARTEALARFQAELGTLVKLEHEGIARIYDGGIFEDPRTHEQLPYIAMELVRGGLPLTTYAQDYALAWPERLTLFVRVCQAVRYAHEHRVVHRDLKPTNILVDHEGRPFVIDFGLASACDAVLPGVHFAASGTPAYMSPEQVSDTLEAVSDRSDVYALGLILYELLTAQPPYVLPRDGSFAQLRQVITEAAPPPLCQFDAAYGEELEEIVAAALVKRPADRLSVAVLRSRLARYLQQLPSERESEMEPNRSVPLRHVRGMETPDIGAPPANPAMQQGQQLGAHLCASLGTMRWLSRPFHRHWRGAIALLMTVAAVLSVAYVSKALSTRLAPPVASGVTSLAFHDQQRMLRSGTPPVPLQSAFHRSLESTPSHGQQSMTMLDKVGRPVGVYTASHALVVGFSNYTYGWAPSPGVKGDVQAVTQTLEKHGFHVVVVMDPTMAELEEAHRDFIGKYGFAPDNRLLLYYAGKGYTAKPAYAPNNQEDWMGYLVTRDTPLPTVDPEGFRRHALSMERFASLAREMQSKHALFVFDTCFSGTIAFALARSHSASPPDNTNPEITSQMAEPVRQFISAGTADQKVPDVSIFRRLFVEALEGDAEADRNGDGYITASELGQFLQEKVTIASQGTQTPQYGKMFDARLKRGEFVFTLSRTVPPAAMAAPPSER